MPRTVQIALLPSLISPAFLDSIDLAIVIDTLRFTTTACQALAAGATEIWTVSEVEEARRAAQAEHAKGRPTLLCGERECRPIAGFDLGNSPAEYLPDVIAGKQLIFSTTNGTRAVNAVRSVNRIALAAMVNRQAISNYASHSSNQHIGIVCAGTDGAVAMEDVLTAGALAERLTESVAACHLHGDSAHLALAAWRDVCGPQSAQVSKRIEHRFAACAGGNNLVKAGYEQDLHFAAQLDTLQAVPVAHPQCTPEPADSRCNALIFSTTKIA
ncbi:2-phosphosulfolactate phosphatase [Aureliella helgolandensis]|uniref:Probable 2-phosphosulfolactate phosphatase n=1 Tax=Aureliella helgolandensis TaxID=2527968 RepID=A0A518GGM6_9BACT|nr:2-phosphosulfolactate phosphatase [Aureliella helgolandensis]QDV27744.1 putative 2-phosphosulfolactate phosphatase [Aureliella helgolandensis]